MKNVATRFEALLVFSVVIIGLSWFAWIINPFSHQYTAGFLAGIFIPLFLSFFIKNSSYAVIIITYATGMLVTSLWWGVWWFILRDFIPTFPRCKGRLTSEVKTYLNLGK